MSKDLELLKRKQVDHIVVDEQLSKAIAEISELKNQLQTTQKSLKHRNRVVQQQKEFITQMQSDHSADDVKAQMADLFLKVRGVFPFSCLSCNYYNINIIIIIISYKKRTTLFLSLKAIFQQRQEVKGLSQYQSQVEEP